MGITAEDRTLNWLPLDHVVPLLTCHCADVIRGSEEVIRKALLHFFFSRALFFITSKK